MKIRNIPGVGSVGFPDDWSEAMIAASIKQNTPEQPSVIRDAARQVGATFAGIPSGLIQFASSVPEGAGALLDSDALKDIGKWMRGNELSKIFTDVPQDQRNPDGTPLMGRQVGEVIGQLGGMMVPGLGEAGAGTFIPKATSLGLSALQQAAQVSQDVDRKRAEGMEIDPGQAQLAAALATPTALLDLPIIGRLGRALPGFAKHEVLNQAAEIAGQKWYKPALTTLGSAAFESATEMGQQAGVNAAIKATYDPQQAIDEGLLENGITGAGAGGGLEVINQMLLRKIGKRIHGRHQDTAAERARQTAPEITPGEEEAIGIRAGMDGAPEIKYVDRQRDPKFETVVGMSNALYGKPVTDLPAHVQDDLAKTYDTMKRDGKTDQEIVSFFAQPIDLTAEPPTRPAPSLPTALAPDAPPVRLTDEGVIDASAVQQPSFLDQLLNEDPTLYERLQGQDVIQSLLASPSEPRGVTPQKPIPGAPRPAIQAALTDEGTISTGQPTEIRREGVRPLPTMEQVIAEANAARQQAEQLRLQRRAEAEAIRAQKKQAEVMVPETGIANERDIDARQRVSRELFGRNYDQLTPEQIGEVDSYRAEGLGEAVQPQEIAEINEFADLPFSRDQYRSALEVGRAAGVNTKPISMTAVAKQAKVKPEVATQLINHMVTRGDAQMIDGKVIVDPTAMGPRYSVTTEPTTPTTPALTVTSLRKQVEAGEKPAIALDMFSEMRRLGIDDIVSTRLVDTLSQPNANGSYANQIISLAMASQDPAVMKKTLNHEAVHAMKAMGLFNDAEWAILQGALDPNTVLSDEERRQYNSIYGDRPDIIQEEAVARGLERYAAGELDLSGEARAVAGQKIGMLDRLGNLFKSKNIQTPSDVAAAFRDGTIGKREGTYAVNNTVANGQAGVDTVNTDTSGRFDAEAGATEDGPANDATQTSEAVDQYDLRAWLTDTDESGEVKPTTEARLSVKQLPVNGRIFASPDDRSMLRKQVDELRAGPPSGSLGGAGLAMRQQVFDSRAGIEALSKKAGTATSARTGAIPAVRSADVASEYASAALKNGALEFVGTPGNGYFRAKKNTPAPFGKDGFITKAYNAGKMDRVFHYLAGARGKELMAQGREKLLTPQQITEYTNYGTDPEVKAAADQWKAFNDSMVDALQASGRIDKATAADWKAKTYLPFYRVDPDTGAISAQGPGSLANPGQIVKLKGSDREIADPIENIVRNVNAITSMAMKNEAMQRVMRDGLQFGYMKQAVKGSPAKNQVTVYVDGKPKKFQVTDDLLYESVTASRMPMNTVMKLAAMPGNFLRESVTLSPAFMARNMMRDSMAVWAQGYTPVPFANIATDAVKALKEAESFKNLERLGVVDAGIRGDGGAGGTAANIRDLMDGPTKNPLKWFADKSKKSEATNRITVFESVMNRTGGDEAQAAFEARELLNFNRRGSHPITQIATAMIPFLNARWQGLDVAYRSATGSGSNANMQRQILTRAAYLGALSSIYAVLASQLPAWQNATPEERDNSWFIPTGTGEAVKVPIPFEFGMVSKVLPERFVSAAMGNEEWKEMLGSFERFLRGTMKIDMPHIISPIYEVGTNYDRFRGREVESAWMRKLDKDYRYDETTSELAKAVAPYSNLSPVQLDHLLRGYLGTSAMYAVNLGDVLSGGDPAGVVADLPDRKMSQMPVVGSLFQREDGARKLLEFYEIRNVAEQAKNTLSMLSKSKTPAGEAERERLTKSAKVEAATRNVDQRMGDLTKIERHIRADIKAGNITPSQGRKTLEELRKRKLEMAAPVVERFKEK